ncbi:MULTISPECIES: 5'-nucleotidase, partial [unclassified Microbacterium]|uniref:5'-nucleotidase n=1 Tax=unclassified Microbacterium TaxID=2609290 RepID=UPI00301B1B6A
LRADLWDTQAEFGPTAVPGLKDGEISFSQANAVLPFSNTLALVTLTGAQFETLLEQQWQRDDTGAVPSRPYLQLGLSENVTYTYDPTLPEGSRITSVTIDGVPLDPAAPYRIGTLSFLAAGGDNFRAFTQGTDYVDTGLLDYEAWIDYLADASPVQARFAKHAVSVTGAPAQAAAGTSISFEVSGLELTSQGTPQATTLTTQLNGEEIGSTPVADGGATVSLTLPADATPGATALRLETDVAGTVVTVPLEITARTDAPGTGTGTGSGTPSGSGAPSGSASGASTIASTGGTFPVGFVTVAVLAVIAAGVLMTLRHRRRES